MEDIGVILLGAGESNRFNLPTKKQWLYIENKPLWQKVADDFREIVTPKELIVVGNKKEISYMKNFGEYTIIEGGKSRSDSLRNALKYINSPYVLVSDIARCCLDKDMIKRVISNKNKASCIVPAIKATDTIYYKKEPIDREEVLLIQTPQLSKKDILIKALSKKDFSDESSAIYSYNKDVIFVEGSKKAKKLTYKEDLLELKCLKPPKDIFRSGSGFDTHPFIEDKKMYLGGVLIDSNFGFKAHSDGDVAIHALIDALLGAIGAGDIGELFPDSDSKFKDIDSKILLKEVVSFIEKVGFELVNIDLTIIAQKPKISPYKEAMRDKLSQILKLTKDRVNIKATTTEKLGFIGREEGVSVMANATVKYFNWKEAI
ncbi:MAG: bifunctional 2-C-methyl-D-erythritol 4-phosphate cytidylyltransferase/2-C-methyl-D-erythritol 2,4-cyclodiphosphate synthase [Epsilonproteobacteria bacterium]|nr:bifunctional 2-C-methyl-D-erythritol 4-phosphate cytidylyltransferase/2-C-methyl-D-erythritol 2,4-cyclodiphosphate synthase [Campylobacterota bacterium]